MTNLLKSNHAYYGKQLWFRVLSFVVFLITVSLLAGYIAITLSYPSLYNVNAGFAEYASPLPFYWGMLHVPSMLIYGIPLLVLTSLTEKHIYYFRLFCICSFLLLLLELNNKIPFLLFPKIDALTAFIFSLVIVPPNTKSNPRLVMVLKLIALLAVLMLGVYANSFWQHQTPRITNSQYEGGVFELKSINIKNDYHKEMIFHIALKAHIAEDHLCKQAQPMANSILRDYPFDSSYKKVIKITFNPSISKNNAAPYELGEISLNEVHKEDGQFACYVKYNDS